MKEFIHIKNFGPLKDVLIEDIKPFTVLIGESGSGKSVLMKVIALFRWIYQKYNTRAYLKNSGILKSPFRFHVKKELRRSGLDEFISRKTTVNYCVEFEEKRRYEIAFQAGKESLDFCFSKREEGQWKSFPQRVPIEQNDIWLNKINVIPETRSLTAFWQAKGATTGTSLDYYFNEFYRLFDDALQINEIPIPYLNIKFKGEQAQFGKKYFITPLEARTEDEKYKIEYKNGSSGMQNAIPLVLVSEFFSKYIDLGKVFAGWIWEMLVEAEKTTAFTPKIELSDIKKKIYLHIEEPELSLFPDAQCDLIDDLVCRCFIENKNKMELFIATHSPYILNHLNLLIKAHDAKAERVGFDFDKLAVYHLVDGVLEDLKLKNDRLIYTNLLTDTLNSIYDEYDELANENGTTSA
ncbi:MAG: AAA family ATPase [Puniceicoccales bacterium]|jgi:predicted ATPase|nr:AAA family ATPase [Puniceicoccales bacterium]